MAKCFPSMGRAMTVAVAFLFSAGNSQAQVPGWLPPNAQMLDEDGTVFDVGSAGVQMVTARNSTWNIQVLPGQTLVTVEGTAEPDFLHTGLFVRFKGKLDKKGVLQEEVKDLEIFTPTGKNSRGVFAVNAGDDAKPIAKLEDDTYLIRGSVATYKEGVVTIVAGKKITGKIAKDAKIEVHVEDLSFVQKDDTVKVKGFYYANARPSPTQGRAGQGIAKEISVTLAKPLAGVQKQAGKNSRAGKGKVAAEEPEAKTPDPESKDPFNLDKGKKEVPKLPE